MKMALSKRPSSGQGFTLIEMLVVFTLLALLLSIAVPRYLSTAENARLKVREQNMSTIRDALDKFGADQGRYPAKLGELVEKGYLRAIPVDPVTETTDWVVVEDPKRGMPGVFDVAPPSEVLAPAAGAMVPGADAQTGSEDAPSPGIGLPSGPMPSPLGGAPAPGQALPIPMPKASVP